MVSCILHLDHSIYARYVFSVKRCCKFCCAAMLQVLSCCDAASFVMLQCCKFCHAAMLHIFSCCDAASFVMLQCCIFFHAANLIIFAASPIQAVYDLMLQKSVFLQHHLARQGSPTPSKNDFTRFP